jgi:hypothetical protein
VKQNPSKVLVSTKNSNKNKVKKLESLDLDVTSCRHFNCIKSRLKTIKIHHRQIDSIDNASFIGQQKLEVPLFPANVYFAIKLFNNFRILYFIQLLSSTRNRSKKRTEIYFCLCSYFSCKRSRFICSIKSSINSDNFISRCLFVCLSRVRCASEIDNEKLKSQKHIHRKLFPRNQLRSSQIFT